MTLPPGLDEVTSITLLPKKAIRVVPIVDSTTTGSYVWSLSSYSSVKTPSKVAMILKIKVGIYVYYKQKKAIWIDAYKEYLDRENDDEFVCPLLLCIRGHDLMTGGSMCCWSL